MATLEVKIKYETKLSRALNMGLIVLSPIWAVFPALILFFAIFAAKASRIIPSYEISQMMTLGHCALPLFVVGLYSTWYLRDNKLILSQQGIRLPATLLRFIGARNCPWHKLSSVATTGAGSNDYRDYSISLVYGPGAYSQKNVVLHLCNLSLADAEQLIMGLETFGSAAKGIETLPLVKNLLKSELKIKGIKSYTNLWDDELRYRYASTTFIPLTPGALLQDGKIKVIRQLGFGGLSAIYLVQCNNRELAILKESVLPSGVDEVLAAKAAEQFEREARILASLNHPQIARVLDHFVEGGHYLLLEYIQGQDLRQYINEHSKLPEETVLLFAAQIADILDYLHSRPTPIIHRDLTPENLIVNKKGKVILIDFGAANEFLHTATGTLVGKHAYMAPEQIKGKANFQSDLYALGCTMHFLLTASDPVPLSPSHPAAVDSFISAQTDQIVFQLTQFSADARPQSAKQLLVTLRTLLDKKDAGNGGA